jgi:hypothetical protein
LMTDLRIVSRDARGIEVAGDFAEHVVVTR